MDLIRVHNSIVKEKVQLAKTVKIKSFYDLHFMSNRTINHIIKSHFCCRIFDFYPIFHFSISHLHYNNQIFEEEKNKKKYFFCSKFTPHDILLYIFMSGHTKTISSICIHHHHQSVIDQ